MNEHGPSRVCLLNLTSSIRSPNHFNTQQESEETMEASSPSLSKPSYKGAKRGHTWLGVWRRQQQLAELGVFNILNPAEVQEPQGWQWG